MNQIVDVETQNSENDNITNECCCQTTKKINSSSNSSSCCSNDNDLISEAKSFLERYFFTALTEVHVEKLKKQIKREWGTTIDKAVDLTIKTGAKQWQASLSKSAENKEFYSELEKIFKTTKEDKQ